MLNYNFNTKVLAKEMTQAWRGYHMYSVKVCTKSLHQILYEFTKSKFKSFVCATLFSITYVMFAKVKHHKQHHRMMFIYIATLCSVMLLNYSFKKSHHIAVLLYDWFWQDRIAHGYMTPLRDEALIRVEVAIFGGDMEMYRTHAVAFGEASVMLDPYEYHEIELADWDKVKEKLEESFVELKRVLGNIS